jgi:hypothetical protein
MGYLDEFRTQLEKEWKGSLVSVREAKTMEPHAKEYLAKAACEGLVERVTWGWYYLPAPYNDPLDFLTGERHFKVLQKQTAASMWNSDFIHRDQYTIAVEDHSFARALRAFAQIRGWNMNIEVRTFNKNEYVTISNNFVEGLEETIVDCVKEWSFTDAFASLYEQRNMVSWQKLSRHDWERIPRTKTRVGQVIKYAAKMTGMPKKRAMISDEFVKRQVDEAIERVVELG